jgi:hypothetical protein
MRTDAGEGAAVLLVGTGSASSVSVRRSIGQGAGASKADGLSDQGATLTGPRTTTGPNRPSPDSPRRPTHASSVATHPVVPSAYTISNERATPPGLRDDCGAASFVASITRRFFPSRTRTSTCAGVAQLVERKTSSALSDTVALLSAATRRLAATTPAGASNSRTKIARPAGALSDVGAGCPTVSTQIHFGSGPGSVARAGAIHFGSCARAIEAAAARRQITMVVRTRAGAGRLIRAAYHGTRTPPDATRRESYLSRLWFLPLSRALLFWLRRWATGGLGTPHPVEARRPEALPKPPLGLAELQRPGPSWPCPPARAWRRRRSAGPSDAVARSTAAIVTRGPSRPCCKERPELACRPARPSGRP